MRHACTCFSNLACLQIILISISVTAMRVETQLLSRSSMQLLDYLFSDSACNVNFRTKYLFEIVQYIFPFFNEKLCLPEKLQQINQSECNQIERLYGFPISKGASIF